MRGLRGGLRDFRAGVLAIFREIMGERRIPMTIPSLRLLLLLPLMICLSARGQVVISEIMSSGSERMLRWSPAGVPVLGTGTPWQAVAFNDATWQTGNGPFGFGTFLNVSPAPAIGTNTATGMQNLTPVLYLRKAFTVSAADAARTDQVTLEVQYNDGFAAWLNGVEVVRRNAGPPGQFLYRDQFAAAGTPANTESHLTPYLRTEVLTLGTAAARLVEGQNVLCIQALNYWENSTATNIAGNAFVTVVNRDNFYFKGDLKITAAPAVTLASNSSAWRYLPGVVEPSGGLYDPALIFQAKQNVRWGRASFDDTAWSTGTGPLGAGTPPAGVSLGTSITGLIGTATSLYGRTVFTATAADVAGTLPLQLLMDWDDGFVAYVNGVEVARNNLSEANSFTPHNAVANAARSGGTQTTFTLPLPKELLVEGPNVLAIQVHNLTLADGDLLMRPLLRTNPAGTSRTLVPLNASWRYFRGTEEPVEATDEGLEDNPEPPDSALDWIELSNAGPAAADLSGWGISDEPGTPGKWTFPAGATIPAGGFLILACDDLNITAPAAGGFYHTGFKLSAAGETLVLTDATGSVVQQLAFPAQHLFHSYARDAGGAWHFSDLPTPGAANAGNLLTGKVAPPQMSIPAGFHTSAVTVTLSSATPGATIRYTLDGSEPTETTGTAGTSVSVSTALALRARAFAPGMIASDVSTRTYLIGQAAARRAVPALCVTAEEARTLYRPYGIMAISGGSYTNFAAPLPTTQNTIWTQTGATSGTPADLTAYNNPVHRGRFVERPANMEILNPNGTPGPNTGFGMRISGSGHARPRYKLTNQNRTSLPNSGAWSSTSYTDKPSFNFFFRDELGGDPLSFPLFPGYPVTEFHDLRIRAGKNDVSNPFIEDEFMRRVFISTGQQGSRGMINTLWVNGVYKGYYNLCEHLREDFFQRHHGSKHAWDVRQVTTIASGDGLAFQEMITFIRNNPQSTLANYQGMKTRLDMVNFIDYLIVNLMGVTGDWPHNNYVCARERSVNGLHRYYLWDAEGAFGDFSGNVRTNQFVAASTGSVVTDAPATAGLEQGIRILYTLLRASPEFKLLFADRLQKHFFNNGALTESVLLTQWNQMKSEFAPLIAPAAVTDRVTPWLNGVGDATRYTTTGATNTPSRRNVLFNGYTDDVAGGTVVAPHLVAEGLWPATRAPLFNLPAGAVNSGALLLMTNPNPTGTIYYALGGLDPRAEGGTAAGTPYTGPVVITWSTTVKARVRSAAGEWSPLLERVFTTSVPEPLVLTELMYHPADGTGVAGDEYEFIELRNSGTQTLQLGGMRFTSGLDYTFPAGATLAAGQRLVLARNAARFTERYPSVTPSGEWGMADSLANTGETLTLANSTGVTIFSVTWTDTWPWPEEADGTGRSLVPVNAGAGTTAIQPADWRVSSQPGGSPGADDPPPAAPPVLISEVMAIPVLPSQAFVELHNPNASAVDVSHWWLSDSAAQPQRHRIATGTTIPAGGYLVIQADALITGPQGFSLQPAGGTVVLSSGDASGVLTGYSTLVTYAGSDPGMSYGRHLSPSGVPWFTPLQQPTAGAANGPPLVGPVVISELRYEPAAADYEFIELQNTSSQPVPLFDPDNPANTWRVEGIGFSFPEGVTLTPGQIVLLVPVAPETFRTLHGIPPAIAIYGPYSGSLKNEGEQIILQRPAGPVTDISGPTVIPRIPVDQVTYSPAAPWPVLPAAGHSIERLNPWKFGDDPANWRASSAAGGTAGLTAPLTWAQWAALHFQPADILAPGFPSMDADSDGISNLLEWAQGTSPWLPQGSLAEIAATETHLHFAVRRSRAAAGLTIAGDTSGDLSAWTAGGAPQHGVAVLNADGTETLTFRVSVSSQRQFLRVRYLTE